MLVRRGFSASAHFFHGPFTYAWKEATRLGISSNTSSFSGKSGFGRVSRWLGSADGLSLSRTHGIKVAGGHGGLAGRRRSISIQISPESVWLTLQTKIQAEQRADQEGERDAYYYPFELSK